MSEELKTQNLYIRINNSFVLLTQYGTSERIFKTSHDYLSREKSDYGKKIVIFLPGNPGVLGVYHDYLVSLHRAIAKDCQSTLEKEPVILAISHNNCNIPKTDDEVLSVEDRHLNFIDQSIAKSHETHDMELQVLNKLIILKQILKVNLEYCQLIFVGHSIGCYVILRLLQDGLIASVHHGSIFIHPALENLALTEKGTKCRRYFEYRLDYILRTLVFLAEILLPKSVKLDLTKRIVCSRTLVERSSNMVIESIAEIGTSSSFWALIQMAKSEFIKVKNLDHQLLVKPHADRMALIYAIDDKWVNSGNRKELWEAYPNLRIEELNRMHAFIMDPDTVDEYSIKVGAYIREYLNM